MTDDSFEVKLSHWETSVSALPGGTLGTADNVNALALKNAMAASPPPALASPSQQARYRRAYDECCTKQSR